MATIDLAQVSVTEANELLLEHGDAGEDVDIVNPDARHHIGVGLTHPIELRVHGSAGYFCAGLTDGPRFEVEGNVGWGLADNMYEGTRGRPRQRERDRRASRSAAPRSSCTATSARAPAR